MKHLSRQWSLQQVYDEMTRKGGEAFPDLSQPIAQRQAQAESSAISANASAAMSSAVSSSIHLTSERQALYENVPRRASGELLGKQALTYRALKAGDPNKAISYLFPDGSHFGVEGSASQWQRRLPQGVGIVAWVHHGDDVAGLLIDRDRLQQFAPVSVQGQGMQSVIQALPPVRRTMAPLGAVIAHRLGEAFFPRPIVGDLNDLSLVLLCPSPVFNAVPFHQLRHTAWGARTFAEHFAHWSMLGSLEWEGKPVHRDFPPRIRCVTLPDAPFWSQKVNRLIQERSQGTVIRGGVTVLSGHRTRAFEGDAGVSDEASRLETLAAAQILSNPAGVVMLDMCCGAALSVGWAPNGLVSQAFTAGSTIVIGPADDVDDLASALCVWKMAYLMMTGSQGENPRQADVLRIAFLARDWLGRLTAEDVRVLAALLEPETPRWPPAYQHLLSVSEPGRLLFANEAVKWVSWVKDVSELLQDWAY